MYKSVSDERPKITLFVSNNTPKVVFDKNSPKAINIKKFVNKIGEFYDWLYDGGEKKYSHEEYYKLVDNFDTFLKNPKNHKFIKAITDTRMDMITSDREAAAFTLTLKSCGIGDVFKIEETE